MRISGTDFQYFPGSVAAVYLILLYLPGHPPYYQTAIVTMAKTYSNSLLAVLNSRAKVVANSPALAPPPWNEAESAGDSIHLQKMQIHALGGEAKMGSSSISSLRRTPSWMWDWPHRHNKHVEPLIFVYIHELNNWAILQRPYYCQRVWIRDHFVLVKDSVLGSRVELGNFDAVASALVPTKFSPHFVANCQSSRSIFFPLPRSLRACSPELGICYL